MEPSTDDRFDLLRAFVLDDINGHKTASAKLLARRAALGDREAWDAVAGDMTGPGRGYASDVAEALGRGDLDAAVTEAAKVCGESVEAWLRDARAAVAS